MIAFFLQKQLTRLSTAHARVNANTRCHLRAGFRSKPSFRIL
jgi:hypothetical protein